MGQISATITDAVDIRAFDCVLPDDVKTSLIIARLVDIMHYPAIGSDGYSINYGLIAKNGSALNADVPLKVQNIADGAVLRLVPEITAAHEDLEANAEIDNQAPQEPDEPEIDILISNPRALLHDDCLDLKSDVRIDAGIHKEIEEFAKRDRACECFGLLLGEVFEESGKRIIHITAAAPAFHADGTRTNVKVSIDSWDSMLKIKDHQYPDLRILGWFHSHAGWGVFLSDPDVFIQKNYFPHPNMLAFVLDPYTGKDGFFSWQDGALGLCSTFGLVGTPQDFQTTETSKAISSSKFKFDFRAVLILLLAVLAVYMGVDRVQSGKKSTGKVSSSTAVKNVTEKQSAAASKKAEEKPTERIHILGKNENLWSVCHDVYQDGELEFALAKYNGIDDLTGMKIGQRIKLPSKEVLERMSKH